MMKIKGWHLAGILGFLMLTVFSVDAFADEASDTAGEETKTMWNLILEGGYIMIPLALASVLAIALALERFIALSKDRVLPPDFISGLTDAWNEDPSGAEAIEFCNESDSVAGHIFKAGVARADFGHEAVEKAIEDVGSREADKLKRSLRPLSVIATVSPLLGLLGTVYGMIDAFGTTADKGGTAQTAELARGIYEALVTTATGLTIAIPVLLLYQFLQGRADRLIDEIDEAGSEVVVTLTEESAAKPAPKKALRKKAGA